MIAYMDVYYASEAFPESFKKSIFLAGPSPKGEQIGVVPDWRQQALAHLRSIGYDGAVFMPVPRGGKWATRVPYSDILRWELEAAKRSDVICFWVPRSDILPGATTNIEWGKYYDSGRSVLGYPPKAPGMRWFTRTAEWEQVPSDSTLEDVLTTAVNQLGDGALRHGSECSIPYGLWKSPLVAQWIREQRASGNVVRRADVAWRSSVGAPGDTPGAFVLEFELHVPGTSSPVRRLVMFDTQRQTNRIMNERDSNGLPYAYFHSRQSPSARNVQATARNSRSPQEARARLSGQGDARKGLDVKLSSGNTLWCGVREL